MPITRILETCIYAADLDAAEKFYAEVVGLTLHSQEPGRHVFFRCGDSMFLVFNGSRTKEPGGIVGGVRVPSHGGQGAGHVAFRVNENEIAERRAWLAQCGVEIEAEIDWPGGGRSIYVRDPAGNSVEFGTPQVWDPIIPA